MPGTRIKRYLLLGLVGSATLAAGAGWLAWKFSAQLPSGSVPPGGPRRRAQRVASGW